ncbi:hypothetical protein [Burkholderia cenocepacia]|uniref:hypothetical protein n=1 Tax=Burkholderia cenocepacia TaxID=95486 RepID=UPI000F577C2F|nr:hypothetical protein [Burkholderia cenocepacia]MCW3678643.1 hypothetical protein [Burkholderia cenocepacia]
MLTAATKTNGVLFFVDEDKRTPKGPLMLGNLANGEETVSLSGFLKVAESSGRKYLDLSLGEEGGTHFSGRLFQNDRKTKPSQPDYTGFLTVLPLYPENKGNQGYTSDDWDKAPKLSVFGRKKRSGDGSIRVVLDVVPPNNAPIGEEETAF